MKVEYVSNTIIYEANKEGIHINCLKLQKLLWFLQGYYGVHYNKKKSEEKLIDEEFIAWSYGAVVPSILNAYIDYVSDPIKTFIGTSERYIISEKKELIDSIKIVLNHYGRYSDVYLSELVQIVQGAWFYSYKKGMGTPIPYEHIIKEFSGKEID